MVDTCQAATLFSQVCHLLLRAYKESSFFYPNYILQLSLCQCSLTTDAKKM